MSTVAAVYLRVSTEKQTVENQRAPLLAVVAARSWGDARVYEEVESAKKARPVFEEMMAAAHRGELRAVVVAALDRLGRSLLGVLETVQKLDRLGVTVVSLREPWLDVAGPHRSLLVSIFAWVAEQEHALIIERSAAGQRRARREGKRIGRPPKNVEAVRLAALEVSRGAAVRDAARRHALSERTLRRRLSDAWGTDAPALGETGTKCEVCGGRNWPNCAPAAHGKNTPQTSAAPS